MKRYSRIAMFLFVSSQFIFSCYSQDVSFSQFYDQPLLRNPALAGIFTGDIRFTASYRNQWQSVTIPYRTFGLSSEIKFPVNDNFTATLGLQLMRDVAGTSQFSTTQALPVFNGSLRVRDNSFLSFALMGGLMQQRFDPTRLILDDQFVAGSNGSFSILPYSNQVFTNTSVNYADLSTGVSYNVTGDNTDYYVGAGLFHIFDPSVGFFEGNKITLNKKIAINGGLSSGISDLDELVLYGDYFGKFGDHFNYVSGTFQVGMMLSHNLTEDKTITGGLVYRLDDAIIPVLQLELSKFNIGISYDVNISKLVVASQARGGFELTLSYKDFLNSRKRNLQGTKCPAFGAHKLIY